MNPCLIPAICILGVASAGCFGEKPANSNSYKSVAAVTSRISWDVTRVAGGEYDDSTLQVPNKPLATRDGVYFTDLAARRIVALDHRGKLRWYSGRKGHGPGEFMDPRDIRVDTAGMLWVLDAENNRITILAPNGQLQREVRLQWVGGRPSEIVPLQDGGVVVLTLSNKSRFVHLDANGRLRSPIHVSWSDYDTLSILATQLITATDPARDDWVAGFQAGDGFFSFQRDMPRYPRRQYAEHVVFPAVSSKRIRNMEFNWLVNPPVRAAIAITLSKDNMYVLFGGHSPVGGRVVHIYRRSTGTFLRAIILPYAAGSVVWWAGGLYVLRADPYPELLYLKPRGASLD